MYRALWNKPNTTIVFFDQRSEGILNGILFLGHFNRYRKIVFVVFWQNISLISLFGFNISQYDSEPVRVNYASLK